MMKNLITGPILARLTPNFLRYYAFSQAIMICNFKENAWSKLKKTAKNILDLI